MKLTALSEPEILSRLRSLPQWRYQDTALVRIHTCHAYQQSLDLLYAIGQLAEQQDHHPDLLLHYKRLTVRYWTHRAKGVTDLDFEAAAAAERLIEAQGPAV